MDVPVKREKGDVSSWSDKYSCPPLTDINETGEKVVLKADLPGVSKDGLKVTVDRGLLTIEGRPKLDLPDRAEAVFREMDQGVFKRTFRLGSEVSGGKIDASLEDGVLTVVMPKSDWAVARKVEVK